MADLMFIESPAKMKSISRYLSGKEIDLFATYGHIREVKKRWMGRGDQMFNPQWENSNRLVEFGNKKISIVEAIKRKASQASRIYLATDPDREGEAISWHIYSILNKEDQKKCFRAVFNEITEKAIKNSLNNTREIDQAIINSYLARVLLDRFVGYKLSDYTRKKVGGISAGRVQSIALKFLVDREDEIKSFKKESWFVLKVELQNGLNISAVQLNPEILPQIKLFKEQKKGIVWFESKEGVEKLIRTLDNDYQLIKIGEPKQEIISPPEALKTSTLYESAINKLGMRVAVVEQTAQKLYEGIPLGEESIALITYPRTDKTDLSEDFVTELKNYILNKYSEKYLNLEQDQKNQVVKKDKLVQGAHEGIRPVDLTMTPEKLSKYIETNTPEYRLYKLIWAITIASFCSPAKNEKKSYTFQNNKNLFNTTETKEIFDGFRKILREYWLFQEKIEKSFSPVLENVKEGQIFPKKQENIIEENTSPPMKYSEATLIKALENKGIGRPSTYPVVAKIIRTRNYATFENKKFEITELGYKVSKDLEKNFSNFISYDYTRLMEEELDNISQSKTDWKSFLNGVFLDLDKSFKKVERFETVEGRECPECSGTLVFKFSRWGKKFIGCARFPSCKYAEFLKNEKKEPLEKLDILCPECKSSLVKRKSKKTGEHFNACPNFPKCRYIEGKNEKSEPQIVSGRTCPKCSGKLAYKYSFKRKSKFISCTNFPNCKYLESLKS
ncbi:DNA topoisomerase I [Mycoplasma ovis str. Michigan]|uniref:DNA topoisomerase 1 n=1 Tax=Mycoplasma ovis str. Michigan TaxID=1415773 RepID=A0ABM5P0W0_9MOLU|nr:type I DNA topoisomerase [Mycoplasma ovis]AHC40062.1 DNA topoisomerase I [Mycoplasma ovis str. Michigan]